MWLIFGLSALVSGGICFVVFIALMVQLFVVSPLMFVWMMLFLVWLCWTAARFARKETRLRASDTGKSGVVAATRPRAK